ncbi:MAG: glycosyltransferase [Halobacteriaceae archaeon]
MTDLGVVVPAYRPDVDCLLSYLDALRDAVDPAVVRIELDAAGPGVVDRLRAGSRATVHAADGRRGKGAAITHGFECLDTEYLSFVDADGSTPAASFASIVAAVADGGDLAVGSRRHPDAVVESHQTWLRRHLGDAFAALASRALAVDLYDFQCGAKAISAAAWDRIRPHVYESGFAWDLEVLAVAAALDLDIAEVPIEWEDRPGSTVDPVRTTADMFRALVGVRHRVKAMQGSPWHRLADWRSREPLVGRDARDG